MIRFNYIPDVDESYKTRLWAILGAKVFSPVSDMRKISISGSGFPVNKILPTEEYQSIQRLSDDGENHIYLLALTNSRNKIIQYVPITFTYKENI